MEVHNRTVHSAVITFTVLNVKQSYLFFTTEDYDTFLTELSNQFYEFNKDKDKDLYFKIGITSEKELRDCYRLKTFNSCNELFSYLNQVDYIIYKNKKFIKELIK